MEENLLETQEELELFQFIVVRLGDEQYGINIQYIDNIVRMQHITRVPKVQEYFKGVINLRGEVIPVMSIRIKMGLPVDEFTNSSRIIIIKMESGASIGVIVDEVREVVTLDDSCIEKVVYDAKEERQNFIRSVGKCNGGLISILDLTAVIGDKEGN
ncbi:chemotaxis protein CheW [bacterium C-53]|nr:chemotaxis protein CheW [Lachnospiraceae bacterium]NBI02136.1 chemotaxis protein CheW [Lachnospiraceae bacterium]RKJ10395.1 chemotaxis protein CheW [bacterium C-53]